MAIYNIHRGNHRTSIISAMAIIKFGDYVGYPYATRYNNFTTIKAFRTYIDT